jgi:biopolymer transport protein ExbD
MGMDLGRKRSYKADINVTPLVDVMLVLLIIMMLIAPLLRQGVPLALPEANNTGDKPERQNQTVVAVDSHSNFYVNLIPVPAGDLVTRVQRALQDKNEKLVYIQGDKDASYSAIMDAMDALHKAHIEDIALITDPRQNPDGHAR